MLPCVSVQACFFLFFFHDPAFTPCTLHRWMCHQYPHMTKPGDPGTKEVRQWARVTVKLVVEGWRKKLHCPAVLWCGTVWCNHISRHFVNYTPSVKENNFVKFRNIFVFVILFRVSLLSLCLCPKPHFQIVSLVPGLVKLCCVVLSVVGQGFTVGD